MSNLHVHFDSVGLRLYLNWTCTQTSGAVCYTCLHQDVVINVMLPWACHQCKWVSRGTSSLIPNLGTRGWWGFGLMSHPVYSQEKSSWHPLNRRLRGPHSQSGHFGKQKSQAPTRNQFMILSLSQLIASLVNTQTTQTEFPSRSLN